MTDAERLGKARELAAPAIRLFDALRELGRRIEAGDPVESAERAFRRTWGCRPEDLFDDELDVHGIAPDTDAAGIVQTWIGGDDAHARFAEAMRHLGGRPSRRLLASVPDLSAALDRATIEDGCVSIELRAGAGWGFEGV